MPVTPHGHGLGHKPSPPDPRNYQFPALAGIVPEAALPTKVDTRPRQMPIYNQDILGSCTAFAFGRAYRYSRRLKHGWPVPKKYPWGQTNRFQGQVEIDPKLPGPEDFDISFLAQYAWSRDKDGDFNADAGAAPSSALWVLRNKGACAWHNDPYDVLQWDAHPNALCVSNAANHKIDSYHQLTIGVRAQIKQALASDRIPCVGMTVYPSFEEAGYQISAKGRIPLPDPTTELPLGGHMLAIAGYDDSLYGGSYIVPNSWGTGWGDFGYCYMPYAMLEDPKQVADLWVIDAGAN